MVDECYFSEEIKAATAEVLKHFTPILSKGEGVLSELQADWSDEQKVQTIEQVNQKLSDPAHPVAIAMERQKTVPEVQIIEGLP